MIYIYILYICIGWTCVGPMYSPELPYCLRPSSLSMYSLLSIPY